MNTLRDEEDREDVESSETWNGGAGTITFNHLQQRKPECEEACDPLPYPGTDIWGITD